MTKGSVMLFRILLRNCSRGETGSISSSSRTSLQPTRQPMKGAASGVRAERGAGGGRVTCHLFHAISTIYRYRKAGKAQFPGEAIMHGGFHSDMIGTSWPTIRRAKKHGRSLRST